MYREFQERMRIIRNAPLKIFIASYNSRYWYPYRLQHAGNASELLLDGCLESMIDSNINDPETSNREILQRATELNADYVIPKDYFGDQTRTTESTHEFLEIYKEHECRAKVILPLQPPYDSHFEEHSGFSHFALGGISRTDPDSQIDRIREFRDAAG